MFRKFTGIVGSFLKYSKFGLKFLFLYLGRKFDLVHIHHFYPLAILLFPYKWIHKNTKFVVTLHGADVNKNSKGKFGLYLAKAVAGLADSVVSVGVDLAASFEKLTGRAVDHILPAGIDERVFFPVDGVEKRFDLIFAGSFYEAKGLRELLEASKLTGNRDIRICFVGSGPLEQEIHDRCNWQYEIHKDLTQEALAELYRAAKYLVLPSKSEAFGLVVSEAMYCGIPTVCSNVGGLKDQIQDRQNGFFFEGISSESISSKILFALNLDQPDYEKLCVNARKSNKQYSLSMVTEKHLAIYNSLVYEN